VMPWNARDYMGAALAVRGDEYFYWGYLDPAWCDGPYRGTFHLDGDVLILEDPRKEAPNDSRQGTAFELRLYSKVWMIHRDSLGVRLYALSDGIENTGRHLLVDTQFNPKHPFRNHDNLMPGPIAEEDPSASFQLSPLPEQPWGEVFPRRREPHQRRSVYSFPIGSGAPRVGTVGVPDFSLDEGADRIHEARPPNQAAEGPATSPAVKPEATPVPHL